MTSDRSSANDIRGVEFGPKDTIQDKKNHKKRGEADPKKSSLEKDMQNPKQNVDADPKKTSPENLGDFEGLLLKHPMDVDQAKPIGDLAKIDVETLMPDYSRKEEIRMSPSTQDGEGCRGSVCILENSEDINDNGRDVAQAPEEKMEDMNGDKGTSLANQGDHLDIVVGMQAIPKVSEVEKERQEKVCKTPKKDLSVFSSLEGEMEREASLSPKPKKKNNREPSITSPVETRSSCKLDVGPQPRRGRRSEKQSREEETKRSLEDGHQKTLLDYSLKEK